MSWLNQHCVILLQFHSSIILYSNADTFALLLLKFWSENNRSLHNNRFCPLKKIPARKPEAESIYHSYLIMHMGGRLTIFGTNESWYFSNAFLPAPVPIAVFPNVPYRLSAQLVILFMNVFLRESPIEENTAWECIGGTVVVTYGCKN